MFQEFPDDNKNDDFLDEFRQKIADQSSNNLEEKRNELKRSQSVFIGAVSGIALAGVVGWFVLAPQYAHQADIEIPVIRRPQAAIKVQPTEPGGMEILNQDKTVYDIIDQKADEPLVENLLPPPEQPKLPEIAKVVPLERQTQDVINDLPPEKVVQPMKIAEIATPQMSEKNTKDAPVEQVSNQREPIKVSVQPEKAESLPVVKVAEVSKPVAPKKAEPIAPKKEKIENPPVATQAVSGMWQIQLMSSPNKKAIEKAWGNLSQKFKMLQGLPHEIEAADLDFDKTFYRLKAGAFTNRAEADKLCQTLKSLGGSCIVKKK